MTNEEILANSPEGSNQFDITEQYFDAYGNLLNKDGVWSLSDASPCHPRALSDIRRIVELESELDKVYNDLANFEGYPEEVSALRRDIERRKQRYLNLLNKRKEWKKRAEAAERERNDKELKITVLETLLSNLWPGNYKPMDAVAVEITEALRQQLNGGE